MDRGVYLAAVGRARGTGETADTAVLVGNGGVAVEGEAGAGAEVQGGAFPDGAEASSGQSEEGEEGEGQVSGSLGGSRGLRRGKEGG